MYLTIIPSKYHNYPGDLEFRWGFEKTFTLEEEEDSAFIRFNPDNPLVGTFSMNVTVYDTVWEKRKLGNKYKFYKNEVSNATIELIFSIEATNDPPNKPRILEPAQGSEFSTDDKILFRGTATDVDFSNPNSAEKLFYKWLVGAGTPLGQGKELRTELGKGTHLITLRVEDAEGATNEVNITITVRNRATIDRLNSSHYEFDENEDVLSFIYEITDEGVEDFKIQRGSLIKIDFFNGDAVELTSVRWKQYLFVNLTIKDNITAIINEENLEFDFSIYLIQPGHEEEVMDITGLRYLGSRLDELYKPEKYYAKFQFDNKYYNNNGMGEFKIINKGRTLSLRAHLGDLEAGEDDYAKLQPDFAIFATVKLEIERHPFGYFQHIIAYDSIGYGSETAPFTKPRDSGGSGGEDNSINAETALIIGIAIIIIIMLIMVGFIIFRGDETTKSDDKTIVYDSSRLQAGASAAPGKDKKTGKRKRLTGRQKGKGKGKGKDKDIAKVPAGQQLLTGPMMPMGSVPGPGFGMGMGTPGQRQPPGFMPFPMMPPPPGMMNKPILPPPGKLTTTPTKGVPGGVGIKTKGKGAGPGPEGRIAPVSPSAGAGNKSGKNVQKK